MADKREASIQNTTVKPSGLNIWPVIPWIAARGIKTTQVVMVDPIMEFPTIDVPSRAALLYPRIPLSSPSAVALKQLSSTTMELSTIIPTPRTRALIVMTFREKPAAVIAINAIRIDVGMELPTIRDAL